MWASFSLAYLLAEDRGRHRPRPDRRASAPWFPAIIGLAFDLALSPGLRLVPHPDRPFPAGPAAPALPGQDHRGYTERPHPHGQRRRRRRPGFSASAARRPWRRVYPACSSTTRRPLATRQPRPISRPCRTRRRRR
ncbi:MAG: hypothetical protein M0C28_38935 [Candidatus Moduliflexus flocculans]|nr:hypothetical protein [Candidatus Moduliflexus flocculans]